MPLPTFNPSIGPSPGGQMAPKISLLEAEFGDGYSQAAPRGLNHIVENVTLKWEGITPAQKTELETFFRERAGYKPFYYQPYGYSTVLKWTCKEWSWTNNAPFSFTAKLMQSFSLET